MTDMSASVEDAVGNVAVAIETVGNFGPGEPKCITKTADLRTILQALTTANAEIARLKGALEPFSAIAPKLIPASAWVLTENGCGNATALPLQRPGFEDFRRAAQALNPAEGETK